MLRHVRRQYTGSLGCCHSMLKAERRSQTATSDTPVLLSCRRAAHRPLSGSSPRTGSWTKVGLQGAGLGFGRQEVMERCCDWPNLMKQVVYLMCGTVSHVEKPQSPTSRAWLSWASRAAVKSLKKHSATGFNTSAVRCQMSGFRQAAAAQLSVEIYFCFVGFPGYKQDC